MVTLGWETVRVVGKGEELTFDYGEPDVCWCVCDGRVHVKRAVPRLKIIVCVCGVGKIIDEDLE